MLRTGALGAIAAAVTFFTGTPAAAQELQGWMNPEIADAWGDGFKGQGTSITVIDDFTSGNRFTGQLDGTSQQLHHGEWTAKQAGMIAPSARVSKHDFTNTRSVKLQRGFNALNLSYGMMGADGMGTIRWSQRESSIISHARDGKAVVVKAAGNDRVAVGAANGSGQLDYLNRDLISMQSVIFVGALSSNGTTEAPASLASYSNFAGSNATVQNQFLVVGVEGKETGLYGTSFAAPIVTGYAAVVSSKFTRANPTQVTNQLLSTARTDTINGYAPEIHGRGEASIARALAPSSIR